MSSSGGCGCCNLRAAKQLLICLHLLACRSTLLDVCQRWRRLCFSAPELWETLSLEAPSLEATTDRRQQWLQGELWLLQVRCGGQPGWQLLGWLVWATQQWPPPSVHLRCPPALQRVGEHVRHLRITDESVAQGVIEPLVQAVPCTLRALQLSLLWVAHLSDLPQLLGIARQRFAALARLELRATQRADNFDEAAQQQPGVTAAQAEARLLDGMLAGVAGLAGSLTELKLHMPAVQLPSLAPLMSLSKLRRLAVRSHNWKAPRQVPALAQLPCLRHSTSLAACGQGWVHTWARPLRVEMLV